MSINVRGCIFGRCIIYQRYLVAVACAMGFINLYSMRYVLFLTVPYITSYTRPNETAKAACGKREDVINKRLGSHLDWTDDEITLIQTSFYFPYMLAHIPAGILSDMYGPRHVLSFGIVISFLVTLVTPTVITKAPWWVMLIMRLLIGTAQGASMTAIFSLVSNWTPNYQISTLVALAYSGTSMAKVVISATLVIFLKAAGSWVALFYFWGGITIAWYCLYLFLIFSSPSTHPMVSKKEKDLITADLGVGYPKSIPWKGILRDRSVWALVSGQIGHDWILFILANNMHTYFKDVLGFDLKSNIVMKVVPYGCMWLITIASGLLGDHIINRKLLPVLYLRNIYTAIGNVLPSIFILLAMYSGCYKPALLLFFVLAMLCKGTIAPGLKANILDITRHYVGVVFAIQNGLGAITGLLLGITINYLCPNNTVLEWRQAFWLSFVVCIFSSMLSFIWSRSDRAAWDNIDTADT